MVLNNAAQHNPNADGVDDHKALVVKICDCSISATTNGCRREASFIIPAFCCVSDFVEVIVVEDTVVLRRTSFSKGRDCDCHKQFVKFLRSITKTLHTLLIPSHSLIFATFIE